MSLLSDYLPPNVLSRLTSDAQADFDTSLRAVIRGNEPAGPGAGRLRILFATAADATDFGEWDATIDHLMTMRVATPFLSVAALYWVEPWLFATERTWEMPDDVYQRLSGMATTVRHVWPRGQ